ncbi:hypothetical protein [Halomonas sp.]|uniref:hypothetical protein n=1 Tax=Halomonas sp. TaxID=1486246 RepID=UPI000C8EFA50|nr:hypothetical protein [Halomonas sp.]MAR70753.1 hypothetical protein [Halomonas sp.]|tara:strand:+ start:7823 stop:8212 length:390 start_codon:yes stop_codon:yes gene_type:complete
MSDSMLQGVLRAPVDDRGDVQVMQLVACAGEAADRIERDAVELQRLRDAASLTGINHVCLATNEYGNPDGSVRQVDQIEVHVMDMWLRKDITCARDVHLAERLADEAGVVLEDARNIADAGRLKCRNHV